MGITIGGQVGPRYVQDGAITEMRQGRLGALVITPGHAKFTEPASRGKLFSITTAVAGTTVVGGNNAPPAAAAATILSLYNPLGSGIIANVTKVIIGNVSGTPGAGAFTYCVSFGNNITATQNAVPKCNYIGGANPVCRGFTQTALTGGQVHQVLRFAGHVSFAAAVAAANTDLYNIDNLDGEVSLPPGGVFTIASAATGTTHVCNGAITWDEVPI